MVHFHGLRLNKWLQYQLPSASQIFATLSDLKSSFDAYVKYDLLDPKSSVDAYVV
jgi:hypothetical protein